MIHKAKDLSPDQKIVLEALLGRVVSETEAISVRVLNADGSPEWLQVSWDSAQRSGVSQLSLEEIDAEIEATRRSRHLSRQPTEQ